MAEPVTIGGQTFIKTPEGWLDKKTKVRAPESLFTLLNSLTSESTTEYKKLRVRIDSSKPPVSLAGEEYVFDLNQGKWINKKTRDAVNDSLQKVINGVLEKLEAEKASAAPAITAAMGTIGQAAKSNVKKPDGAKMPVNIKINSPIVTMIEKLATIDGYLKQKLDNQKKIAARNISMAKETAIEATPSDASPVQEVKTEDASKNNTAAMATALLVGGLIAAQFEPVQEAFKSLVDGVKGVWNFVSGVAGTIADGLDAFTGSSSTSSTNSSATSLPTGSGSSNLQPSDPNTVEAPAQGAPSEPNKADATPVVNTQSTPNQATPSQPSSGSARLGRTVIGAAVGGAIAGPVGAAVGGAIGFLSAPADEGAPNYSPTSSSPSSPSSSQPSSGNNATGVERVGAPSGGPMGDFAANFKDPVPNGKWSGPGLGQSRAGGSRRHQGMDIFAPMGAPIYATADGEVVYSERRSGDGGSAGFGMAVQLKHADGYTTKYAHLSKLKGYSKGDRVNAGDVIGYVGDTGNAKGTPPHLHFEIWKGRQMQEPANFLSGANRTGYGADDGSGTGDNLMGMAQNATSQLWNLGAGAIEALGSVISAGLGPMASRSITESLMQTAPNTAGEIAIAAVSKNAKMAEVNTPAIETGPMIKDPPNISKSGSTDFIQNAPTASDMSSIDYYLTRMGLGLQQSKYNALGGMRA
jgi:murein DD-endopeptidase MepM/ murein hydrolase activator NlpD